jgi:hypothetical protein
MFQISIAPPRKAASALTVLAAMGASGMVSEFASAAIDLEPTDGARGLNASYIGTGNPTNWVNWLAESGVTNVGNNGTGTNGAQRAYATWNINFGAGPINSAGYRIDKNGASREYGIPAGATLDFALITEPWSSATPDSNNLGPDVGTTLGVDFIQVTAPADDPFVADVTPLLLTWQANPSAYYGIRWYESAPLPPDEFAQPSRGGVWAPSETTSSTGITGNLVLDQVIPEPSTLSLLAFGGAFGLRRRRMRKLKSSSP